MITIFLNDLKDFIDETVKNFSLPTPVQKDDVTNKPRAPELHLMRLPRSTSYKKYAPYIIIQVATGKDGQPTGKRSQSAVNMRLICCTYCENEEEGALMLINVMDAIRFKLLESVVIVKKYKIDTEVGIEYVIYPEDTAPYYAGEIDFTVMLPPIEREVSLNVI